MKKTLHNLKNQNGVSAIILALALVVLLGFAALAVDMGYIFAARNELQNAADAAALAATRELGRIYSEETLASQDLGSGENAAYLSSIYSTAISVAAKNVAAGGSVAITSDDITIGQWDPDSRTLTATLDEPDAVRVTPRREAGSAVTLFFARVLGIFDTDVSATATAALTGLSEVNEGGLPIPVGISRYWFEYAWPGAFCDQNIKFYPTGTIDGCAGWHTYESSPPNASKLRKLLDDLRTGDFKSPETETGDEYAFTGGTVASAFDEMKALYDANKDADGKWKTTVVVYNWMDCSNPNKTIEIVGFARVEITQVLVTPEKTIVGKVICNEFEEDTRGGGAYYGIKGAIPGLVK
jgi:Flp pilus assembly protein TadG/phage terminase large subunit-like protein